MRPLLHIFLTSITSRTFVLMAAPALSSFSARRRNLFLTASSSGVVSLLSSAFRSICGGDSRAAKQPHHRAFLVLSSSVSVSPAFGLRQVLINTCNGVWPACPAPAFRQLTWKCSSVIWRSQVDPQSLLHPHDAGAATVGHQRGHF